MRRVDATVRYFAKTLYLEPWDKTLHVVTYRKRVHHRTRKNFQLDLFDRADGYFEYSAVVINTLLSGKNLWYSICWRGSHEKAYLETIQSLRYQWLNRAGRLTHPNGYPTLDLGTSLAVKNRFFDMNARLSEAA